jgi:hypothetical protein
MNKNINTKNRKQLIKMAERAAKLPPRRKPTKLVFGRGNAKLSTAIVTFSLPAGHSCPFALDCLSKADRLTGKITDGKATVFRCFAASQEALFGNVRRSRWDNYEMLKEAKSVEKMMALIQDSLPKGYTYVRVHVSGDFYSERYFLAWLNIALNNPLMVFYGYTKATPFLVKFKQYIPRNFRFTASKGGTRDNLISKHRLKSAEVVYSVKEAADKGLQIDHDDSHAIMSDHSFALLIHGTQPAKSKAAAAWEKVKKTVGGYGEGSKRYGMGEKKKKLVTYITFNSNGELFLPQQIVKPGTYQLV